MLKLKKEHSLLSDQTTQTPDSIGCVHITWQRIKKHHFRVSMRHPTVPRH